MAKKKVRDLIDSLYNNYPIGYIITWKSPDVRIKDGKTSNGRLILIDGQQRITALSTALSKIEIVTAEYKKERIVISFNPITEEFKVRDKSTERGREWITDIADAMDAGRKYINDYLALNEITADSEADTISERIERLKQIKSADIGNITLDAALPIDIVTQIFIRINDAGVKLSQADFIMSRIAIFEKTPSDEYGIYLRKYIDYFCELAAAPENMPRIENNDKEFSNSIFWRKVKWIANDSIESYMPNYSDILRVVSLIEFNRGKLSELVALLSGRDFVERDYKQEIALESFNSLERGIDKFTNKGNYTHFVQDILLNLHYDGLHSKIPQNAINYTYAVYLRGKELEVADASLKSLIRRLLVLTLLTERHSGSFESTWSSDFKEFVSVEAFEDFVAKLERQNLTDVFWTDVLPSKFDSTNIASPAWTLFSLAQRYLGDQGFLTSTLVRDMKTAQIHHIYPKAYLIKNGFTDKNMYNKLANYVYLHDQVNNRVNDLAPKEYMTEVQKWKGAFGNEIDSPEDLFFNTSNNAIPEIILEGDAQNYLEFLKERQLLMAQKIKEFYSKL